MRRIILTILATLAFAPSAVAQTPSYPGMTPTDHPALVELQSVARAYWNAQGITGCPNGIPIYLADDLTGPDHPASVGGRGWPDVGWTDCGVALWNEGPLSRLLRQAYRPVKRGWIKRGSRRATARYICRLMIHEVGHAYKQPHAETGVMAPSTGTTTPPECYPAVRRLIPFASRR